MTDSQYIFLMVSPDRAGILAAVAETIAASGGDIRDAASFGDEDSGEFFIRIHLSLADAKHEPVLRDALTALAARFSGRSSLRKLARRMRLLVAASKFDHCLADLLNRWATGSLGADIPLVVSNHENVRPLCEWHGVPFKHVPVDKDSKPEAEAVWRSAIEEYNVDLVVLARYMQILSPEFSRELKGRCINIHHSFLPSFKGALPYRQAHRRGVKLIGATAHYVTDDLDEGPIIEQDVRRVNHATSAADMQLIGREIESSVLARAVRWHVEHRVLLNGTKTVVFNS
ncbi:MAG: formyltetrahydrofolate deformylase [Pseudomonadota bacterium]